MPLGPPSVRTRRLAVAAAVVLAAAAVYTGYWFHVAGEVGKGIDRWAADMRARGWTVELGRTAVGGFPGAVTATVEGASLSGPSGTGWQGGPLSFRASPFDLTRIRANLAGRHRLTLAGQPFAVEAGAADLALHLRPGGRLDDATLTAAGVTLGLPGGVGVVLASLSATLDPADDTDEVALGAAAQGVELPALPGLVMDRRVGFVDVRARILGAIPPGPPLQALTAWSAAGGTIELDRIALEWAPLALEAEGTLAFDPARQPEAAMSARVRGYGEFMDRLARAGTVDPAPASAAKLLLGLLAKPDSRGRSALAVPITLQQGTLYLGPARVATVPPIPWPPEQP